MKKIKLMSLVLACSFLCSLCACKEKEEEINSYPVTVFDTDFEAAPASIVSLSPSVTQDMDRLGLLQTVVGQSSYCDTDYQNPPDHDITVVGSPINPDMDAVLKLAPACVFTSTPMPDWMESQLASSDVTVVDVSTPQFFYEIFGRARDLCTALMGVDEGLSYADEQLLPALDLTEAVAWKYMYAEKPSAAFLIDDTLSAFTGDTLIQDFMTVFGLRNAASDGKEYAYGEEQLLAGDPEYLFLSDEMDIAAFSEKYPDLQAVKSRQVYAYDLTAFERANLSLIDAFEAIARKITPDEMAAVDTSLQQLADEREAAAMEAAKPWYQKTWEKVQNFFGGLFGGNKEKSGSSEQSGSSSEEAA